MAPKIKATTSAPTAHQFEAYKNLPSFNAALKKAGLDVELVKGNGYFYYYSPDLSIPDIPSVYACHFSHLTPEQWGKEFEAVQAFVRANRVEPQTTPAPRVIKISRRPSIC